MYALENETDKTLSKHEKLEIEKRQMLEEALKDEEEPEEN